MSHSITVQRTVTTTHHEGTAFVVNTGVLTTGPGILKLLQLACGIITVGIMGHHMANFVNSYEFRADMFFLLMAVFALITTFCVVLSMFLSIGTASILPRTFFEVVYHFIAFLLLCAASITLIVKLTDHSVYRYRDRNYEPKLAAASIGLINSLLYLCTFVMALRSWRLH
ncbi:uncharacterized protein LOC122389707 [Amphibalanus amphitrite]|uniref:uncharacterized protein LOC122389707 n=1 Tax=Amphibalanus amphitrite TaxID=1232801 RepID=UPI001C90CCCC|nr:uncharacterized protein LOC122389707 [Amphibalanus amphitrite]XP_043237927.1 uncharacterized protein LOC122389707 [Amphibalanus amphitrite]